MKNVLSIVLFSTLLITMSCSVEESKELTLTENENDALIERLLNVSSETGRRDQPPIWADCYLYSGIVTPATFKPESDPFDELYAGAMFKDGMPLISDSKPGDKDYNGGRWHLNVLKAGVDPYKYANACSEEDLDLSDFDSTDAYFSCPMRPRNN